MQPWAAHICGFSADAQLTDSVSDLFETPDNPMLPSLKRASVRVSGEVALFSEASQDSMPKVVRDVLSSVLHPSYVAQLASSPLQAADVKTDFKLDATNLLGALDEEAKMTTVTQLRNQIAEALPTAPPSEFGQMLNGISSVSIKSRHRAVEMEFEPYLPVFGLFVEAQSAEEEEGDEDDEW